MNRDFCNMNLASPVIAIMLLFVSFQSFSRDAVSKDKYPPNFCKVVDGSADVSIPIGDINILPGAEIGTVIASSPLIGKTIICSGSNSAGINFFPVVAYADVAGDSTGVSINGSRLPDIIFKGSNVNRPSIDCRVIKSTVEGVGYAWFNYNSGTSVWNCATDGTVTRGLGSTRNIYDVIVLVKTGEVTTTDDNGVRFNKSFGFIERCDINPTHGNNRPNNCSQLVGGSLYNIYFDTQIKINAPKCSISKVSETYALKINEMINNSSITNNMTAQISCSDGLIEDGTIIPIHVDTPLGLFILDNNYYATSSSGLGVSVAYKMQGDSVFQPLPPENNTFEVKMPVAAGDNEPKAYIEFKYTPYIKADSGIYPLTNDMHFDLNLSN